MKKRNECRVFTMANGEREFLDRTNGDRLDADEWVCVGRGKSYIKTIDGRKFWVCHYIPSQSHEAWLASMVEAGALSVNAARGVLGLAAV